MSLLNPLSPFGQFTEDQKRKSLSLTNRGEILHLLTPLQKEFVKTLTQNDKREVLLVASRKVGKSFTLLLMCYGYAIKNPNSQITLVAPTAKEVREIFFPLTNEMKQFFQKKLWPRLHRTEKKLIFGNGSVVTMDGLTKEHLDGLRGPKRDLIVIDEAFFTEAEIFEYAIRSIFRPQLQYSKTPTIVMTSTMPVDINHPLVGWIPRLKSQNAYHSFTIWQNSLLKESEKQAILSDYPKGEADPQFRREYMCELIADSSIRLVPEFDASLDVYSGEWSKYDLVGVPTKYICYQAADCGAVDFTSILTGLYDHNRAKLVITAEWRKNQTSPNTVATEWFNMRGILETTYQEPMTRIESVIDVFDFSALGFRKDHNMDFRRPTKTKQLDAILYLRNLIENRRIVIHESCQGLIWELNNAVWDSDRKDFSRKQGGHADSIMALIYMCRLVIWNKRVGEFNLDNKRVALKEASNIISNRRSV